MRVDGGTVLEKRSLRFIAIVGIERLRRKKRLSTQRSGVQGDWDRTADMLHTRVISFTKSSPTPERPRRRRPHRYSRESDNSKQRLLPLGRSRRESEMPERLRRRDTSPHRALQKAVLQQERL